MCYSFELLKSILPISCVTRVCSKHFSEWTFEQKFNNVMHENLKAFLELFNIFSSSSFFRVQLMKFSSFLPSSFACMFRIGYEKEAEQCLLKEISFFSLSLAPLIIAMGKRVTFTR